VKRVRSRDGAVFLVVYDSDESFMKAPQAKTTRRVNASKGDLKIVIHDVTVFRQSADARSGRGKYFF
jgi:hypothetical protein